jgi:Fe-S-cluster-containing dehydrogenase component/formate-dependent nitrite reductase membrane component NrfD
MPSAREPFNEEQPEAGRVRYGFVIDQTRCIGCHACTVACKEENHVPVGVFRTWVKYVERGTWPGTRRYFSVLRCNHCENAPCVTICPTRALYHRADGIVDFDGDQCIGCKSCMQACPYDALYIDPATNTAAKCHYCAHRVESGLEPACVIVCPEQAIIAGDLDDPHSRIARLVATEQVQVRKAEQGTRPKVFYVGADAAALTPSLQAPASGYMWAERPAEEVSLTSMLAGLAREAGRHGDDAMARPVYDAPHVRRPWGWKVGAYLWTKSIAAGALLVAAAGALIGGSAEGWGAGLAAPLLALIFLGLTTALLVADLKRPERFLYLITKGNRHSWLVIGAFILMGYGAVATIWLLAALAGSPGALVATAVPAIALAVAAAGYSAFLFGQAEGRDFWQSPLLLPHLLAGAILAGAACLILAGAAIGTDATARAGLATVLGAAIAANALLLFAELAGSHASADAAQAARLITRGHYRGRFWGGVALLGTAAPLVLLWLGAPALAALCALAGAWIWEDTWVLAGQTPLLS